MTNNQFIRHSTFENSSFTHTHRQEFTLLTDEQGPLPVTACGHASPIQRKACSGAFDLTPVAQEVREEPNDVCT